MGGLGNQLFQIAATLAYSIQYDISCVFPYSEELTIGQPRPTYWNTFLLELKSYTTHYTNALPITNEMFITNEMLFNLPKYHELSFQYIKIPHYTTDFMLSGYFQSYKYFEKYKDEIYDIMRIECHQYTIKKEYPQYFLKKTDKFISIHFRLGDYKHKPEFHPILPYEYYEKSLEIIPSNELTKYTILYCCEKEDNDHCLNIINRLKLQFGIHQFIKVNDKIDDWKQLLIMSCCHINIIANSSFSLWAAYFNLDEDKIVIYPNIWFGPRINNNTNDMFPPEWIKITI
jgi:hypothetical protein